MREIRLNRRPLVVVLHGVNGLRLFRLPIEIRNRRYRNGQNSRWRRGLFAGLARVVGRVCMCFPRRVLLFQSGGLLLTVADDTGCVCHCFGGRGANGC